MSNVREINWPIVTNENGCHVWQAHVLPHGYGTITVDGKTHLAHRYVYSVEVGPIPDGLHIDHLCRNRACVNPAHLEPVTQAVNNRRAADAQETCRRGHVRTPENTRIEGGYRRCMDCRAADPNRVERGRRYRQSHREHRREWQRQYRARRRAEQA